LSSLQVTGGVSLESLCLLVGMLDIAG